MKEFSIFCLLAFVALCGLTACNDDPESINNAPEVFVDEATDLMRTSAVLTGRIMAPANASIEEYGFKVSSTSDFSSADTDVYRFYGEDGLSEFSKQITDLEIGGTYFYVAYATNGLEEMTSTLKTFTTPQRSGVLLSDLQLENEKPVIFSARVGDTGGGEIHAVGFCWSTDDIPTTYDETVLTTFNSDNTFTASLSGLKAGVTYYVRAFADSDILGDGTTQTISYSRDVFHLKSASNKIWYTLTDSNIVEPNTPNAFGAKIVSNTYENGQGVILFDGPVTKIGNNAFYKCASLTDITIPDGVTSIGYSAFSGCTGLTSITIPDNVTSIGEWAFYNCSGLINVAIGDGALTIGSNAFRDCTGLTNVTIGNGVTSIGELAFYGCSSLTSVTIPDSVTSIGDKAFCNCTGLTSVTIPNGVTSIGEGAFWSCSNLTNVTIPDSVTSIGDNAFCSCTSLTNVTIGNGVTSIGELAFRFCHKLTSVYCKPTIPPAGKSEMFNDNSFDRKIYVPAQSVDAYKAATYWSDYANYIYPMDEKEKPEVTPENCRINYTSTDGNTVEPYNTRAFDANIVSNTYENGQGVILFDGPVTEIGNNAFQDCNSLTSITIPNSVTSIGQVAFFRCSCLSSATIPESVTSIGEGAFYLCYSLTSVNIGNGVTSIGHNTFLGCSGLTSVTIGNSVTSIGRDAFNRCSGLTSVTIPDSVTLIDNYAFENCSGLTNVYCKPTTPPSGGTLMFNDNASDRKIYVPNESVDAYKAATYWSDYTDAIVGYEF